MRIKAVIFKEPVNLLGKSVKIFLKDRQEQDKFFWFYVEEAGVDYIAGHDDESLNLKIDLNDIDFIIG